MSNWRITIPFGFIIPFLILIIVEYGFLYGLSYYKKNLDNSIYELEQKLKQAEDQIKGNINEDQTYIVFSKAVNIMEIWKNKKSLTTIIDNFNKIMPKFLSIKNFSYDDDLKEISIAASVPSWKDYLRFYKYVYSLNVLAVKSLSTPASDDNGIVSFSIVFSLKPAFFQQ